MNMIKEGENCIRIHNSVELNIYFEDFIYFYILYLCIILHI